MITLKTLPQATAQEVFDQVKDHLLKQGERATMGGYSCAYKTKDGLKCAAGCLIEDGEYRSDFEGKSWCSVAARLGIDTHVDLINGLQSIHDNIAPENWAENLKTFANNFKLVYHD